MPKNTAKDTTNTKVPASITAHDALGRGNEKTKRVTPDVKLTPEEMIAVRTEPSAATALDGKFRKDFMVAVPKGVEHPGWDDPTFEHMHVANGLAVLQEALGLGLHAKASAVFEGEIPCGQKGSALLRYAVEVVPAVLDTEPGETVTPRSELLDMDGNSTFAGDDGSIRETH